MPALLDSGFNISTLTAIGGEGKSYITVHDMAYNRLVRWNYHLVTNLPLHVEKLAEVVARERGCEPQDVIDRIHLIPSHDLDRWRNGHGGPWDLPELFEANACDFILDEAHVFCPPKKQDEQWAVWLGEARHLNLQRVQFLTQSVKKIAAPIDIHAKLRYRLEKGDRRRMRWFLFPMGDVYQVIASFTGRLTPLVYRIEEIKDAEEKWKRGSEDLFSYRPEVYTLYDTHSDAGGSSEAKERTIEPEEFQRRPKLLPDKRDFYGEEKIVWTMPTWLWAIVRNPTGMFRLIAVLSVATFILCGGVNWTATASIRQLNSVADMITGQKPTPRKVVDAKDDKTFAAAIDRASEDCGCPAKRQLVQELAQRVRKDRESVRGLGAVVAISPKFVAFDTGDYVRVGERINAGRHAGKLLVDIDFDGRRVKLSDGGWVPLRRSSDEKAESTDTEVSELLQRADQLTTDESIATPKERSILKPSGPGNEALRAAQPVGQGDESLLRR